MRFDYCVACMRRDNLNHHHLKPRVHGGSDDNANMITLCRECHGIMHNAEWSLDHVELVKAGQEKVKQRSAAEWREVVKRRRRQALWAAERAKAIAEEAEAAAVMEVEAAAIEAAKEAQQEREASPSERTAVKAPHEPPTAIPLRLVAGNPEKRASDRPKPILSVVKPAPAVKHGLDAANTAAAAEPAPIVIEPTPERRPYYYDDVLSILYGTEAMQRDKQFRREGDWGLASDGVQWVLQHRNGKGWEGVSFVTSTKEILARCMSTKGVPADTAAKLLEGLPSTFNAWMNAQHDAVRRLKASSGAGAAESVMMPPDAPPSSLAA